MHQNQVMEPFTRGSQLVGMVTKGEEFPHKYSGIDSSKICSSSIHKRKIKYTSSLADRQRNFTFISFENEGYVQ